MIRDHSVEIRLGKADLRAVRRGLLGAVDSQTPAASRGAVLFMMTIDRWLSHLPFLRRFYGAVTIVGTKDPPVQASAGH